MKHTILIIAAFLLLGIQSHAQTGVAINPTGAEADSCAMLDVSSTTKGLLVPRMTLVQRTAIVNPVKGLLVYQNDSTEGFYYYDGSEWTNLSMVNFTESNFTYNSRTGVKFIPNNAAADVDLILQPKRFGAIIAQQPDGTDTGGNRRGYLATDLQRLRTNAAKVASGNYATIVGGSNNTASGESSTAMGSAVIASGILSTAMGGGTTASGHSSTAMGSGSTASGNYSTAMGRYTTAPSYYETALGSFNTNYTPVYSDDWDATDRLFVVGNGTSAGTRSNALTIFKDANTMIGGRLTINSNLSSSAYSFPANRGFDGEVLTTNGVGGTYWSPVAIGTVTSVTGIAPISVETGTTTPVISISPATTSAAGSMSAADKAKLDKFPEGTASGQMLYWTGTTWVTVANGTSGQLLSVNSSGQPEWKSQLSIITASTLTPSMSSSGVTFKGVVNPNNLAAAQFFQYGTTTDYGSTTETTYYAPGSTNNTISSSQITGLTVGATYHVRLVTQTILGTFYSNDITFTYVYPGAPLYLGATYQEGIVFYLDGTGQHGKVCAFYDQSASATWYDALPLCAAYSSGTVAPNIYDDWYLPSTNDLTLMYNNLKVNSAGSFSNSNYWSFEAFDDTQAFYVDFGNGNVAFGDKNATYKVRAVRDF